MDKIIIVEAVSSSVNYIEQIYKLGYEPILLESYCSIFYKKRLRRYHDHELDIMLPNDIKRPCIINAKRNYNKTLKLIRNINPICIIPGSDSGIDLAIKLSNDLGLVNNDVKNLEKMRNKYVCQEALKENGIRSILSKTVSSFDEVIQFYKTLPNKKIVIKPICGVSTKGVFICENEEEIKKALKVNQGIYSILYGRGTGKVLIQEYIDGKEYVFNTVSCNGIHKVTEITEYKKEVINSNNVYDAERLVKKNEEVVNKITEYGFKVLDAIGIKYGATHCEIAIDEKGPVLIEANCRLSGGNVKNDFQLKLLKLSESELSLLSYINPDKILENKETILYDDKADQLIKYLILSNDINVNKLKFDEVFSKLPGFEYYYARKEKGLVEKTSNLSNSFGYIFFISDDETILKNNYEYIKSLEKDNCRLLYK